MRRSSLLPTLTAAIVVAATACSDRSVGPDPSELRIAGARHFACAVRAQ